MICPGCGTALEINDDATRAYCPNRFCHAMVKLDNTLYGLGAHHENAA